MQAGFDPKWANSGRHDPALAESGLIGRSGADTGRIWTISGPDLILVKTLARWVDFTPNMLPAGHFYSFFSRGPSGGEESGEKCSSTFSPRPARAAGKASQHFSTFVKGSR